MNISFLSVGPRFALSLALSLLVSATVCRAALLGPYDTDVATLHLYHLDESAVPSLDAKGANNLPGLLYGATLGNESFAGFGSSVSTLDGGQDATVAAARDALITASAATPPGNVSFPYCDPVTGAFTFEAIVWIGFNPDKNLGTAANGGNGRNAMCQILTGESTANGSRIFQFRICPKGVAPTGTGNPAVAPQPLLTFENIRTVSGNQPTIFATIPTNGPNAIVSNQWYHAAVSYNGVPNEADNLKFYWTPLDGTRTEANQLPITSTQTTLNGPLPLGTANTPFVIGNTARNIATAGNNFLGSIDEVRISKIARAGTNMMFGVPEPVIVSPPSSVITLAGNPVTFNVLASGAPALAYQWRHDGTNLPGATLNTLTIASSQAENEGLYELVVTNDHGAITSAPASLTLRVPVNLTWIGTAGDLWDSSLINWDSTGDNLADAAYTQGDDVNFGDAGSAVPTITLNSAVTPHSTTVSGATDYTITTTGGGSMGGFSKLAKSGSGKLTLDVDCPFVGPSSIHEGMVQLGVGANRGSLGTGPVTNNGSLVILRSGALTFTNWLAGSGSLVNNGTNTITVSGTNLLSGPITLNAGTLTLAHAAARGLTTEYTLNANANSTGPTTLNVGGGVTFGPDTTLSLLGSTASPDYRCTLNTTEGTNTFSGTINLGGDGNINFASSGPASNSLFLITTPVINVPAYTGQLILRGNGNGLITSQLTFGNKISKTDGGTWTLASTGNSWVVTDIAGGTLRMGVNNVFPDSVTLNLTTATGILDLAGHDQTIDTLTGVGSIANSSTTADSILTAHPAGLSLFNGVIRDSTAGGTRKVGLTLTSGALTLAGTNTYTGDTTVLAGSLELFINGSISNSANIRLAAGATLDAMLRSDQTFTLNPGQTLKGDGAFNISGNLASAGTIELKLNKAGAALSQDTVQVSGAITYGGTLKLNVAASPALTPSDTFPIFTAGLGYSGAFAEIVPGPGFGLAWDASTLATDGVLRIATSTVPTTGTNVTVAVVGEGLLEVSWPENYLGWRLQAQTNSVHVGLSTNWVDVPGSGATNRVFGPVNPANGSVFYRMVYP